MSVYNKIVFGFLTATILVFGVLYFCGYDWAIIPSMLATIVVCVWSLLWKIKNKRRMP